MTALSITRTRSFVLAALVLIGTLLAAPAARADQQGGTIAVSASVTSSLSLTITDPTMDFGSNLNSLGPTSDSTDTVYNTPAGPSVYYRWRPTPAGQSPTIASVTSSTPWSLWLSMRESDGSSPDLQLAQDDFRASYGWHCDDPVTAADIDTAAPLHANVNYHLEARQGAANSPVDWCFFLRVEAGDEPGSFASAITLTVTN